MRSLLLAVLLLVPTAAGATQLGVRVVDGNGRPVSDAVVTLRPIGRAAPAPRPGTLIVAQRNLAFRPFVSVVAVGSTVVFPNFDATRHHVYSFSAAKRFEFKLFGKDQSRSIVVDKPGTIALGCNIHDSMSAFLFVTDTAWASRTDGSGTVNFGDAPSGPVTIAVWHPYQRTPDGSSVRQVTLGAAARSETFGVKLRSPPMHDMSGY